MKLKRAKRTIDEAVRKVEKAGYRVYGWDDGSIIISTQPPKELRMATITPPHLRKYEKEQARLFEEARRRREAEIAKTRKAMEET